VTRPDEGPVLRFHSGWRLLLQRAGYLSSALKYSLHPKEYPLYSLGPLTGGALHALWIARRLKLRRIVQLNDAYFSTPLLPHYPSRAYDHMAARGGLNIGAAGTPRKQHINSVFLGITRRCDLHCQHCYEHFNTGAEEVVPISVWKKVIRDVQAAGAGVIILSGGEPMLRYEGLLELLKAGDKDLSDFHIHTSGQGVTLERARELRREGLIAAAVGLDDVDPARHDRLRGSAGSHQQAVRALQNLHSAGIFTYTNMCLTRELVRSGDLWTYFELARNLHVGMIEMLEPRPCGGFASRADEVLLTDEDREKVMEFFIRGNTLRKYRRYPLIYHVAFTESPGQVGCTMGGLTHLAIDSKGNVNPCVFLPVTFGNILNEDFQTIYARMKIAIPRPLHKECPSVHLAPTLRERGKYPVPYEQIAEEWNEMFA